MLILFLMQSFFTKSIECRAFCQDVHASPWTVAGKSCTINCHNVVAAVARLKSAEYDQILRLAKQEDEKSNTYFKLMGRAIQNWTKNLSNGRRNSRTDNTLTVIQNYYTVLNNETVLNELINFGADSKYCMKIPSCRRSAEDPVKKLNSILNKYNNNDYLFAEKVTEIILRDLLRLPQGLRLGFGLADVNKLLGHLQLAMTYYRTHSSAQRGVTLRPTNCANVNAIGCFCTRGYVEDSGQCVLPRDCIENEDDKNYLTRIIVE